MFEGDNTVASFKVRKQRDVCKKIKRAPGIGIYKRFTSAADTVVAISGRNEIKSTQVLFMYIVQKSYISTNVKLGIQNFLKRLLKNA